MREEIPSNLDKAVGRAKHYLALHYSFPDAVRNASSEHGVTFARLSQEMRDRAAILRAARAQQGKAARLAFRSAALPVGDR